MSDSDKYSGWEKVVLVVLRFSVGWHMLYEGISKIADPNWSASFYLRESKWFLTGFSEWILSNDGVLQLVDLLNSYGLTAIGAGLILGLFTRVAALSGAFLLLLYYMNSPPLTGLEYAMPMEGNNLIINKTFIEAICLVLLAIFPAGRIWGFDGLWRHDKLTISKDQ